MTQFYSPAQRRLQDRFDTRRLADAIHDRILRAALTATDRKFIASRDFFFLSSVDRHGYPTVSYKGGAKGLVTVVDDVTLAFPAYDGNGMFYSLGNIEEQGKVGLLFIDMEHPKRLRAHGRATVSEDDPLMDRYPEAKLVVRVAVETIFTNCPRYIHRHRRIEDSAFVPAAGRETPVPDWKRVDYLQDSLPEADRARAERAGPRITEAEYRSKFWASKD